MRTIRSGRSVRPGGRPSRSRRVAGLGGGGGFSVPDLAVLSVPPSIAPIGVGDNISTSTALAANFGARTVGDVSIGFVATVANLTPTVAQGSFYNYSATGFGDFTMLADQTTNPSVDVGSDPRPWGQYTWFETCNGDNAGQVNISHSASNDISVLMFDTYQGVGGDPTLILQTHTNGSENGMSLDGNVLSFPTFVHQAGYVYLYHIARQGSNATNTWGGGATLRRTENTISGADISSYLGYIVGDDAEHTVTNECTSHGTNFASRGGVVSIVAIPGQTVADAFVSKFVNPGSLTVADIAPADVTTGQDWFTVGAERDGGTVSLVAPVGANLNVPGVGNSYSVVRASSRFDTGGVSDGAYGASQLHVGDSATWGATGNDVAQTSGCAVGVEVLGSPTFTSLATGAAQGVETDPTVASVPAGDTYDCLLVIAGWGPDSGPNFEADFTADVTPSWGTDSHSAHHGDGNSRKSAAFVGIAPPSEDAITLELANKGFAASGWRIEVLGLTF